MNLQVGFRAPTSMQYLRGSTSKVVCQIRGCVGIWEFPKITVGVPYFGDLIIKILLFRVLY